jgi:sulfhydrogenase subunit alpha
MTHSTGDSDRLLEVHDLARVEGEGALRVVVRQGQVAEVELNIFEPPRFFEALLRGRRHDEAPDITARVCGICPVAYQTSACAAMEQACGVRLPVQVAALRRLLYCGEWIQSHALHIYLLHAPDFLHCQDAVGLAQIDRGAVERGLRLKRTGNLLMETVGGRAIHPVNVRLGGFHRAPTRAELESLRPHLLQAVEDAAATVSWVSKFDFPDLQQDYLFVSLLGDGHYPIEAGRVGTSRGWNLAVEEFEPLVVEDHVERSTALHARLEGRDPYLTGPLSRYALNSERLPDEVRRAAASAGLGPVCRNPFQSIVVRSVELLYACQEALRLIDQYQPPDPPAVAVPPRAGSGTGGSEAPRGLLLHRYEIDAAGIIRAARLVPPTSQNQLSIEADLRRVVEGGLQLPDSELTWRCEQTVRNYDPCISCAAHFLDLSVERMA